MAKIYVVTGGCGFIGSHICDRLLATGQTVRVIDDLSTGRRENVSGQADLRIADIRDRSAVEDALRGADGVFHLAAVASAPASIDDWPGTNSVNLGGTVNVLDVARSAASDGSPIPVIYASSAAVYGEAETFPIREDHPLMPLSGYAADKAACELHADVAAQTFAMPTIGLRLFNVYGPRQDPSSPYSGVMSLLLDSARRETQFTIYGDGLQTRDFVWVGDVADAFVSAMTAAETAALSGEVFNICSGTEISLHALVDTVKEVTGVDFPTVNADERTGDIKRSLGTPERARQRLSFSPDVSISAGLEEMWA